MNRHLDLHAVQSLLTRTEAAAESTHRALELARDLTVRRWKGGAGDLAAFDEPFSAETLESVRLLEAAAAAVKAADHAVAMLLRVTDRVSLTL